MLNQVEKFHTILNGIKSLNIMDTDLLKTIMELEKDNEDEVLIVCGSTIIME